MSFEHIADEPLRFRTSKHKTRSLMREGFIVGITNPKTIAHINRPFPRNTSDDQVTPALASAKIGSTA